MSQLDVKLKQTTTHSVEITDRILTPEVTAELGLLLNQRATEGYSLHIDVSKGSERGRQYQSVRLKLYKEKED